MLRCGAADAAQCLQDHVRPHLSAPKPATDGWTALAPCHPDAAPSLSVSVKGDRVVWNCFSCLRRLGKAESQVATRNALIRTGVSSRCLPQPKDDAESQLDEVRCIMGGEGTLGLRMLRIAALLGGWDQIPRGGELEAVAESCHIAGSTAYALRAQASKR